MFSFMTWILQSRPVRNWTIQFLADDVSTFSSLLDHKITGCSQTHRPRLCLLATWTMRWLMTTLPTCSKASRTALMLELPWTGMFIFLVLYCWTLVMLILIWCRRTGQPRGFAHADFVDIESAVAAKEKLGGRIFFGRALRIDYAAGSDRERPGANSEESEMD